MNFILMFDVNTEYYMTVCFVLLPRDWLIRQLHECSGVQVFLVKWAVHPCTMFYLREMLCEQAVRHDSVCVHQMRQLVIETEPTKLRKIIVCRGLGF